METRAQRGRTTKVHEHGAFEDRLTLLSGWLTAEPCHTFLNHDPLPQEREASPDDPVIMNPFRHNIPATIKNVGDLPQLDAGEDDD